MKKPKSIKLGDDFWKGLEEEGKKIEIQPIEKKEFSDTELKILAVIAAHEKEGIAYSQIMESLGISGFYSLALRRFINDGIVTKRREGKWVKYFPNKQWKPKK